MSRKSVQLIFGQSLSLNACKQFDCEKFCQVGAESFFSQRSGKRKVAQQSVEWNNTTLLRSNLQAEIVKLKQQPGKNISVGGLNIASQLAQSDLIDEYRFLIQPIVAGKGPRLFESGKNLTLELIGSKTFRSGVVALHYKNIHK